MTQKLTAKAALFLCIPPVLWAGNAIVGRLVADQIPPMTLNFSVGCWHWRSSALSWGFYGAPTGPERGNLAFGVLGLTGMGCYNSFQYLALQTSTP